MKSKILSLLISVLVAVGLWVYVITVVDPEYARTYKVPVNPSEFQYSSVLDDRKLMIMECEEYVTVTLKGNRSTLAALRAEDLKVQASVANVTEAKAYSLEYTVSVPGALMVETQKPDTIRLVVDKEESKPLEIRTDIVGETPQNFVPDTEDIFPDIEDGKITISGPSSVLKKIAYAKLDGTIDLSGKEEDVIGSYELVLCNEKGNPVDASRVKIQGSKKVSVRVRIEMFKDIKLGLDVIEGGGLTKENVTIEPGTIRVSGPKAAVVALGDTLILGQLDLSTLDMSQPLEHFAIDLKDDRLVNRTGIEEAAVTVDFGSLAQRSINVSRFNTVAPKGMSVILDRKVLSVVFRGPQELLDAVTEEDITVDVDYSDVTGGTAVRVAKIRIKNPKFRDVVAVGDSYEVSATIK